MVKKVLQGAVMMVIIVLMASLSGSSMMVTLEHASPHSTDWTPIEQAMGKTGTVQGDVLKFSMPRSDLKVMVGGVQISPLLALGSWVAFKNIGNGSMAMGDLVLTEEEVAPVMKKLGQGGIDIMALHNHLLGESPRVMYMHISGHGDPTVMAKAIHDALTFTGTPFSPPGNRSFSNSGIDTKHLDDIIGYKGKVNGDVYQFSIPRVEKIMDDGVEVPPSMGVAMSINFQPTDNGKAVIAGDLVLTANEVNPVIHSLNDNGIEVTAVHSHMLTEEPRLFFLHFWADDDAYKLARGLRATLNSINIART